MSQNHIETMFGLVRRRFGWNNNPTAMQFRCAYCGILNKVCDIHSGSSNVSASDTSDLDDADDANVDDNELDECLSQLSQFVDDVCVCTLTVLSFVVFYPN